MKLYHTTAYMSVFIIYNKIGIEEPPILQLLAFK